MKSPLPSDMKNRTISNIIVVFSGILMLAVMFYFGKIWHFLGRVLEVSTPFIIGFAIAFLLIPIVNKVEWFFNKTIFKHKKLPRLNRAIASTIAFLAN